MVYLIVHDGLDVAKVGICGSTVNRITIHEGHGWRVHETLHLPVGADAALIENRIKHLWFKTRSWAHGVSKEQMPQGGHTETVALAQQAGRIAIDDLWKDIETEHTEISMPLPSPRDGGRAR
ncbi:hypothetical protein ABZW10_31390 [Kitasatospora sp. NPDC004723]|uniref:hypothetical protein n=1 Tax=Kitasatospora sp. NPDC004723 TaxID=3154288 RepID=UPI0033A16325